jgi:BirA family biotin operon repressor/biotin-[acetyl-CoA-carboxylase] ligase
VDPGDLLAVLLSRLERRCHQLAGSDGRVALAGDARAASATIGRAVRAEVAGGTIVGTAEDVTDEGHLRLRTADGAVVDVAAGDVVHLRPC